MAEDIYGSSVEKTGTGQWGAEHFPCPGMVNNGAINWVRSSPPQRG
jgi:hypothetical protein